MQTWDILINGKSYSRAYTNFRSPKRANDVVAEWKQHHGRLGYATPEGQITARPYMSTGFDNYGVRRGG